MALMAMMIPTDPLRPLDIPRCVMVGFGIRFLSYSLPADGSGARPGGGLVSVTPLSVE
jgi:hypothetical protein